MGLSIGQVTIMAAGFTTESKREESERKTEREREREQSSKLEITVFYISSQKGHPFIFVTLYSLIVNHQAQPTLKGRGSHSMYVSEEGITGSILETAYYRLIFEQRNK